MSDPNLVPRSSGGSDLGTTTKPWGTIHVGTAAAVRVAATTLTATNATISGGSVTADTVAAGALTADTINGVAPSERIRFADFKGFYCYSISSNLVNIHSGNNPFTNSSSALDLTVDMTRTGVAGGLMGTLSASTWYYFYIIYGTSGTSAIASTSYITPTLPTGYTYAVRVGCMTTSPSRFLFMYAQRGNRLELHIDGVILTEYPPLATGSVASLTTLDISWFFPKNVGAAMTIQVGANSMTSTSHAVYVCTSQKGVTQSGVVGVGAVMASDIVPVGDYVYYYSNDANGFLRVLGWVDNL